MVSRASIAQLDLDIQRIEKKIDTLQECVDAVNYQVSMADLKETLGPGGPGCICPPGGKLGCICKDDEETLRRQVEEEAPLCDCGEDI